MVSMNKPQPVNLSGLSEEEQIKAINKRLGSVRDRVKEHTKTVTALWKAVHGADAEISPLQELTIVNSTIGGSAQAGLNALKSATKDKVILCILDRLIEQMQVLHEAGVKAYAKEVLDE